MRIIDKIISLFHNHFNDLIYRRSMKVLVSTEHDFRKLCAFFIMFWIIFTWKVETHHTQIFFHLCTNIFLAHGLPWRSELSLLSNLFDNQCFDCVGLLFICIHMLLLFVSSRRLSLGI